jgi:predicted alpha-1,2-mannosidase
MRGLFVLVFLSNLCLAQNPSQYVNPFIGTGGHGHTFPGATVPFGMVHLSPDTRIDGSWDGCSGYHYSDSFIYGFSHTHLSGTGVSDYGDILLLPSVHPISFEPEEYKTKFSHNDEVAKANYYKVELPNNGVKVELTASTWAGFHRYTFEKTEAYILLDLKHRDKTLDFVIKERGKHTLDGFRISEGWAKEQHCYFSMDFTSEITEIMYNEDSSKAVLYFENLDKNQLEAHVGISFTSIFGAQRNLAYETGKTYDWVQFDEVMADGQAHWDQELSKVAIFTEDEDKKFIFYTALYHCMIHPNIAEDVDGKYRGHDMKIHDSPNHTQYTVFSLWDTYRALHPLMTIIDERRTTDFINTFLEIYKQSGRLPVWELASNETDCMIGYHSVSVITDAYMKGIRGFDTTLALEAMVASANSDLFGLPSYLKYGFIRAEDEPESVSKTLEYSYDDWCIAQMARAMGEDSIADVFDRRSESWRNVINPETGFATPRLNGDWLPNFDPKEVNLHFTEANSWQYSFVQQAIGGAKNSEDLENKLDAFFSEKEKTTGRTQSDITGLIGQYAHGNEPSHHIAYLYNYLMLGNEKTKELVTTICDSFYKNSPSGLIGNEDCGQMSAWYVLSSCGIYPITPGLISYGVGYCQFDSVYFNLENGNIFKILTQRLKGRNSILGVSNNFESHTRIKNGSILLFSDSHFEFGFGSNGYNKESDLICPTPLIIGQSVFEKENWITLKALNTNNAIYYYLNGDSIRKQFYSRPFSVSETTKVSAFSKSTIINYTDSIINSKEVKSPTISATFYKKLNNWTCTPSIPPNPQYNAGGDDALIDGIRGTTKWQAGKWQGYQTDSVSFIIDLKEPKKISSLSIGFLQDSRSWILMPKKVVVYVSQDGINWLITNKYEKSVDFFQYENFIETIALELGSTRKKNKFQYVKVDVYSAGKFPEGHIGSTMNGDAFFFVDEIEVY